MKQNPGPDLYFPDLTFPPLQTSTSCLALLTSVWKPGCRYGAKVLLSSKRQQNRSRHSKETHVSLGSLKGLSKGLVCPVADSVDRLAAPATFRGLRRGYNGSNPPPSLLKDPVTVSLSGSCKMSSSALMLIVKLILWIR